MSPRAPLLTEVAEDERLSKQREDGKIQRRNAEEHVKLLEEEDPPSLCLLRKLGICAGLLAADGGLVFMQLAMLPSLQTLGVPLASGTVPGCLSGALALVGLPWLGIVSDGGTNPLRRKFVAVVASTLVFVIGFALVISGCGLHLWGGGELAGEQPSISEVTTATVWSRGSSANSILRELLLRDLPTEQNMSTVLPDSIGEHAPTTAVQETEQTSTFANWTREPLFLGIPLGGVLAILGFAFIDMGNDLTNSSLKTYMLASVSKPQHVSLLLVAVLMSAVGGCLAAALGVSDVASLILAGTILEAVPSKTLLQCAFFIALAFVCILVSLLCTPRGQSNKRSERSASTIEVLSPSPAGYGSVHNSVRLVGQTASTSGLVSSRRFLHLENSTASVAWPRRYNDDNDNSYHQSYSSTTSRLVYTVADNDLVISTVIESADTVALLSDDASEENFNDVSCDVSVYNENSVVTCSRNNLTSVPKLDKGEDLYSVSIKSVEVTEGDYAEVSSDDDTVSNCTEIWQHSAEVSERTLLPPQANHVKRRMSKKTQKLIFICISMFFMTGAWQSFNICITDYLGKVINGGNPDADPESQSYLAYQQGMQEGSFGVLLMNVAYVFTNLLQRKLLSLAGPKAEQLTVCVAQIAVLITLQLTDNIIVFYVAAVIFGIFRSTMYTIPFMLANDICQEAAQEVEGQNRAKVGSTIALVTSMIPLSNILVSSLTGPLIEITANPASPIFYTIVSTVSAAAVFCCI